MNTKTQELVTAGYALANGLDAESATLVKQLADELAVQRVRADELNKQVVSLAVENAAMKSSLMFWDADNPELPYDCPEEIASECELNYNEEFVVQVAAKLPNRTYRVCESWEFDCKIELVEGAEPITPATDAAIANIQAQGVDKAIDHLSNKFEGTRQIGVPIMALEWLAVELRKDISNYQYAINGT